MTKQQDNAILILRQIVERRGPDYLREGGGKFFVNAFAELGGDKQDVKLLRYLIQCGGHEDLLNAGSQTPAMQRNYYSRVVQKLCDEALISEDRAHGICNIFWQAVYNRQPPLSVPAPPAPKPEDERQQKAPDISGSRPEFEIVNGALLKYNGTAAKVVVPGGVTRIGPRAFFGNDAVRSVSLPYGLIGMGKEAFAGCRKLREITIPGSVIAVHMDAFAGCRMLKKITLESGVQKLIFGDHLDQLGNVTIVVPDTVRSVTWSSIPDSRRRERMKYPKAIQASKRWTETFQQFFQENPDFRAGRLCPVGVKQLALLALAALLLVGLISAVTGSEGGRTRAQLEPYGLEKSIENMLLAGTEEIYTYPDGTWMEFYYDDAGQEIYRVYVNTENDIENLFEARYDDSGRLVYHQSFDGEGNLLRADSYDFHSSEDTAQRRITLGDGRSFQGQSTFDENGYETFTLNHQDGTKTVYVYKDGGVLTRRAYYDAEGNSPEVTSDAMQIGIDWENVSKVYGPWQTVIGWNNVHGFTRSCVQGLCGGALKEYSVSADAAFIETYDPIGNLLEELYYTDGQMTALGSREIYNYDPQGNYTGSVDTFYYGDGNYTVTTYDASGIELSMEVHRFEGEEEIISYHRYETELDDQGREICVREFDGETGQPKSIEEYEYDSQGNRTKRTRTAYAEDGGYSVYVEDGEGKDISDAAYYPSGNIRWQNEYSKDGVRSKWTIYYESGQIEHLTEYNTAGEEKKATWYYISGQTKRVTQYNDAGEAISETGYYENGKTEFKHEYNAAGQVIRYTMYYENGNKHYLAEYNDQGELSKSVWYNEDGTVKK